MNKKNELPTNQVGNLGEYQFVATEDNTRTLWSSFFDETFHNVSGALKETLYTYIEATKVSRVFASCQENLPFSILEVGFGMGLGLFALDSFLKEYLEHEGQNLNNKEHHLNFTSFEIDEKMLMFVIAENSKQNVYQNVFLPALKDWKIEIEDDQRSLCIKKEVFYGEHKLNFYGKILIGDGRKVLKHAKYLTSHVPYKAIFQDPFSPRKNPDLWTVEWFNDLKNLAHKDVILSTYSSSTSIRKSLLEAQWILYNQKGFAHKKAMTMATLNEFLLGNKDQEVLRKLSMSLHLPIYDRDLNEYLRKRELALKA